MDERSKDDLAEALAKLAGGDVAPSEELPAAPIKPMRAVSPLADFSTIPAAENESVVDFVRDEDSDEVAEDDWEVNSAPGAEGAMIAPAPPGLAADRSNREAVYKTLAFRRTIIPVLLTCGVMTIIVGSLKSFTGVDSLFSDLPGWLPGALVVAGVVLLVLAVMNMLVVRAQLKHPRGAGG